MFNPTKIRSDFPILSIQIDGKDLIYLDNAATSQKPKSVLEAMNYYYLTSNANVNRGAHLLGEKSTLAYENSRKKVQKFINAKFPFECIFTRNATESLNLVARTVCETLKPGDEILLTKMEHHSNIVPWLMMKERFGLKVNFINVTEDGRLDIEDLNKKLTEKTKLLSLTYISNVLGTINPIKEITAKAHKFGALVCVDGCQAAPHIKIDVQDLDVDFLAFSAHKMMGPMGTGLLYGKREILEKLPPFLGGGDMIQEVFEDHFTPAYLPNKFEAGTPNVAGAVGLAAAIDYLESGERLAVSGKLYEETLKKKILEGLQKMPFIKIIGPKDLKDRIAVFSFVMEGAHSHDVGEFMNSRGIAIRTGHHCAQPLMDHFNLVATSRISPYIYNTEEEIDKFLEALEECFAFFK